MNKRDFSRENVLFWGYFDKSLICLGATLISSGANLISKKPHTIGYGAFLIINGATLIGSFISKQNMWVC